jgi:hypothetical protein
MDAKAVNEAPNHDDSAVHAGKRKRVPKSGNSELFNEILSGFNALTNSEKLRLVRSLAGQVGLVTLGANDVVSAKAGNVNKGTTTTTNTVVERPNPLKGTKFQVERDNALIALREAKKAAPDGKLPPDDPTVLRYKTAVAAYKAEHQALSVLPSGAVTATTKTNKASKKRTTSSRSPVPKTNILSRISSAVERVTKSSKKTPTEETEVDMQVL